MDVPDQFVEHVEATLDQAVGEGWLLAKNTAATVCVTVGVLLANVEASCGEDVFRGVRKTILAAIGAL